MPPEGHSPEGSRRMTDVSDQAEERGSKPPSGEKLPRAHKRCINKDCREILSLATKVRAW